MEIISISLLLMLCLGIHRSSSDILQRQKRNWIIDSFSIEEENEGPFPFSLGTIEVEKKFTTLRLHGEGVDIEPKNILQISPTGEVTVHGKVDYERNQKLQLTFEAFDNHKNIVDTRLGVEVQILDINDNTPTFDKQIYELSLEESASQGTFMLNVRATDRDSRGTDNGTFDMRIVSVTPQPSDLEFYLKQKDDIGSIKFRGCLDHEKAEKYTILVEAKDHGEKKQLSSTCTIIVKIDDQNNHLPVFTGQKGPGKVKEYEENVLVLQLQVDDKDTKGTEAWEAVYKIHGDTNNNFRIVTDPETNDGLLYVDKALDYEVDPLKNLTISVENKAPYFSCTVRDRSTSGDWSVVTTRRAPGSKLLPKPSTRHVTVNVEDVNDPPMFSPAVKHVKVEENVAVGHYLETFTAIDLDGTQASKFQYTKGDDPGNWVTLDSKTGKITTAKILDRESPFVKDNTYEVTIYAVDSGVPPLTGTGTLIIRLKDQNDNTPVLATNIMNMCLSDGPTMANITAFDIDGDPYSGPFQFRLRGDVKGKWRVDPDHGYSVNLVKENIVYAGHHDLQLEVFDLQDYSAVHNLTVTVCNCANPMKPDCSAQTRTPRMGGGAIGIALVALLLLLGILLLALLLSCKEKNTFIPIEDLRDSGDLMISNTENPGTDCKVALNSLIQEDNIKGQMTSVEVSTVKTKPLLSWSESMGAAKGYSMYQVYHQGSGQFQRGNSVRRTLSKSSSFRARQTTSNSMYQDQSQAAGWYQQGLSMPMSVVTNGRYSTWRENNYLIPQEVLLSVLDKKMYTLQKSGQELGDYAPYLYAEEGDEGTNTELEAISILEVPFNADNLLNLDPKFKTLASICMPNVTTS